MQKPKRQPKNLFKRFMESFFFFPSDFAFHSPKSLEEILEAFKTLAHEEESSRLIVKLVENGNDWQFELRKEKMNRIKTGYNTEEKLEGRIHRSEEGITEIDGSGSFAILMFFPFLFMLAAAMTYFNPSSQNLGNLVILALVYGFGIFLNINKRDKLLQLIETIL